MFSAIFPASPGDEILTWGAKRSRLVATINYVALTIVNALDWGMDIQQAIDALRMGSRSGPTELERGTALERLTPELARMGHSVRIRAEAGGVEAPETRAPRASGKPDKLFG